MIYFILEGHNLHHEVQTSIQIFYPNKHYYETDKVSLETITVKSILAENMSKAEVFDKGEKVSEYSFEIDNSEIETLKDKKRVIKKAIYIALNKLTGYSCPWGMLTGIRPAKTVNELIDTGKSKDDIFTYLTEKYLVTKSKATLAIDVALAERKILNETEKNDISIYIGIPFCPTRCLYCSFAAYPLDIYRKKVDLYIDALLKEIQFIGSLSGKFNITTIYIGGGTPTSLNEGQLEKLLKAIQDNFDINNLKEYTVEAGRPDTITREKLRIIKKYGVNRISINPQTMNQKTLDIIGRKHTVEEIKSAFNMAREEGHQNINMDIILGLPEEGVEDVTKTLEIIHNLNPESITVHTLAVKRASRLKENFDDFNMTEAETIEKMLEISHDYANKMNMKPYYMYRQKNMLGSFENLGYAKEGTECIYNIEIMEEKQIILGAGAGSTTKLIDFETNRIDRIFNVKSVDDYINRIDEMIQRKKDGIKF